MEPVELRFYILNSDGATEMKTGGGETERHFVSMWMTTTSKSLVFYV